MRTKVSWLARCTAVPDVVVLHAIAVPCSQCTHQGNTYTRVSPPRCNASDHHQSTLVVHMRRERVPAGSGEGLQKEQLLYLNTHAHNQVRDITQLCGAAAASVAAPTSHSYSQCLHVCSQSACCVHHTSGKSLKERHHHGAAQAWSREKVGIEGAEQPEAGGKHHTGQ